jgi:hypothetical protein
MNPLDYVRRNGLQLSRDDPAEAPRDRSQNQDKIPERLNTPEQVRENYDDQRGEKQQSRG